MEQLGTDPSEGVIARGLHQEIIACGSAKTLVQRDSGALVLLDQADGSVLILPTPEEGMFFDVAVKVSVTSNDHVVQTGVAASEFMLGGIQQMIDTTAVSEGQFANGTSHITMTMNGTTEGGLIGTVLRFTAINSTQWVVTGLVAGSGTLVTPFTT